MVKPSGGGSRVRKTSTDTKPHLTSAAWESLSAASGAGPFSMQFKSQFPAHHCRGAAMKWILHSHQFQVWPFSQKSENQVSSQSNISLRRHGIPFWQFWGLVPFPYSSKHSLQHTTVVEAAMNWALYSHQFLRPATLFYKETLTTAALWLCRSTLMRTTRVSLWSRLTL